MGTRATANIAESTELSFQLLKNGEQVKASSVVGVKVYNVSSNFAAATPVVSIDPTGIAVTSTGLYTYTVPIITVSGTYYDVITLDITGSGTTNDFINSFVVDTISYSGEVSVPDSICTLYGTLISGDKNSAVSVKVSAIPDDMPAVSFNSFNAIIPISIDTYTDDKGYFELDLIQNINYRIAIRELNFYQRVLIPKQSRCELWGLSTINIVGDQVALPESTTTTTVSTTTADGTTTTTTTTSNNNGTVSSNTGTSGEVIPDPGW